MNIGQAIVQIGGELSGLEQKLGEAEGKTTGWASRVGSGVKTAMTGVIIGGATLAAGAVATIGKAAWGVATDTQAATLQMQSNFGLTAEEAERAAGIAREVWGDNWGESIEDAGMAVGQVIQQLEELGVTGEEETGRAAAGAIALRDSFQVETSEGISAAKTLMDNFGLSSEQAFDFLASGYQKGLDRSGDFLDTIEEYGVQFSEGGASAEQFFSLLDSGLQGGMLGTDKAADAFKEFRVRINDGSQTTADALSQLGLDTDEFVSGLADGSITTVEAWDTVVDALRNTDNEALRMQAGVGLIGTQFEDLGWEAVEALDLWSTSTGELAGGMDNLSARYSSFPALWEGAKRKILTAMTPISDTMLNIANRVTPILMGKVEDLANRLQPIFEAVAGAVDEFFSALDSGATPLEAIMEALDSFLPEGTITTLWGIIDGLGEFWGKVQEVASGIWEAISPFLSWKDLLIVLGGVVAAIVIPALIGIATTLAPIIAGVAAVIGIVSLLRNIWESDWAGIRTALTQVWEGTLKPALAEVVAWLQDKIPAALATLSAFWTGTLLPAITAVASWITGTLIPVLLQLRIWIMDKLTAALGALSTFWTGTLLPAMQAVGDWITGTLVPALSDLWDWLSPKLQAALSALADFWTGTLLPAMQAAGDWITGTLVPVLTDLGSELQEGVGGAVQTFTGWIDDLKGGLQTIITKVGDFIDKLRALKDRILDTPIGHLAALLPGSPPPLAVGLSKIGKEMDRLTRGPLAQFSAEIGAAPVPQPGAAAAGQAPDRVTEIHNHWHLTIQSQAESENVQDSFETMQALAAGGRIV